MKKDIREATGIIIGRNNEYLVCVDVATGRLRWSNSPYDAWITRKREHAFKVAYKVKGTRFLFNPIAGQIRKMGDVQ